MQRKFPHYIVPGIGRVAFEWGRKRLRIRRGILEAFDSAVWNRLIYAFILSIIYA